MGDIKQVQPTALREAAQRFDAVYHQLHGNLGDLQRVTQSTGNWSGQSRTAFDECAVALRDSCAALVGALEGISALLVASADAWQSTDAKMMQKPSR